ncbi:hypothetical protein NBRC110019_24880 [Neptunitalea chrysea]|uniref:Uncharacterized protein n=1 Tax=Neptunitalea chrysea TaxID=1647581 RepID=A0A9W6B7U1_9FLAO|nr:hypothetical protein [Neptunitalea chrysea]GLB53447.1 hypothetical protein NBRC110019_24880 [Neptunitalea chrysea]
MATLIPSYDKILNLKVKPEQGELHLLKFLDNNLDSSFEIYFNPYMNGDRPDIVVMKEAYNMLEQKYRKKKFHKIKNWTFEKLWTGYEEYLQKTLELSGKSSYREADKHLWGKSFYEQLEKNLRTNF